jgi:hypothetical protein
MLNEMEDFNRKLKDKKAGGKPSYFQRVAIVDQGSSKRLDIIRSHNAPPIPEELDTLYNEIQSLVRVVQVLFINDIERLEGFFNELGRTASTGLVGSDYSPEAAWSNLKEIKKRIAHEFPMVCSYFWWKYLKSLLFVSVIFGPIGALLYYASLKSTWGFPAPDGGLFYAPLALAIAFFWIPVGVMLGTFLEFIFRIGDELSFEKIQAINPGRWEPLQRIVNTTITSYCFAALMAIGVFQIGVANVLLNEFMTTKPFLSIAIGLVTGLSFPYVRDIIYQFRPVRRDTPD